MGDGLWRLHRGKLAVKSQSNAVLVLRICVRRVSRCERNSESIHRRGDCGVDVFVTADGCLKICGRD